MVATLKVLLGVLSERAESSSGAPGEIAATGPAELRSCAVAGLLSRLPTGRSVCHDASTRGEASQGESGKANGLSSAGSKGEEQEKGGSLPLLRLRSGDGFR